jgi:uncharacterized protein
MNQTVVVRSISLYPIKSLDGVAVPAARILAGGTLEHDREFALFDDQGKWINGKRDSRIHRIRAEYDLSGLLVSLRDTDELRPRTFHLVEQRREAEAWFEDFFGVRVQLRRDIQNGFPDDVESTGPTIVGAGTLREVSSWFGIADPEETRRRFRANIELATELPFWEDRLFDDAETQVEFRIGDVTVLGVNPCQRCAVPSRNPSTGAVIPDFQRVFAARREETLPPWATLSRFNHYYRLSVNTRLPVSEAGKSIRCGDEVRVRESTARPKLPS